MELFRKLGKFAREYSHKQQEEARASIRDRLVDYVVIRNNEEHWVENRTRLFIHEVRDSLAEIRMGHWKAPRSGNDRTAYIIGLYGTGRWYLCAIMQQTFGDRAKYIRHWLRFHPGPTSLIYFGHATMRHVSRGQRLPSVTSRILKAVGSGSADLIFIYRHPLDALLTNWVWWRTYIRERRMGRSITEDYKNGDDLCVDLERDFLGFEVFAKGDSNFFAGLPGPPFLSFSQFVEETELFIQASTTAVRLEDFMIDPRKELSKIAEVMSVQLESSEAPLVRPRTIPYRFLEVKKKVPRFKKFVDDLDATTIRRIEQMGYSLS